MSGSDDEAALREVHFNHAAQIGQSCLIETHGWFVEKPDGTFYRNEARERQAAALAFRQEACFIVCEMLEFEGREIGSSTLEVSPELQVFFDGESGLQGLMMADVVRVFANRIVMPGKAVIWVFD